MQILNIEQNSEEWMEWRRPNIGGSGSKDVKPLTRGKLKGLIEGSAGFWKLLAGKVAIDKDDESDRDRGHRLEATNLEKTNEKTGLSMVQGNVWISEYSKFIHISPDGADEGDQPKNAFEGKSFDTHKHLMTIYFDLLAKEDMEYNPIDSLPKDNQDQAIKYFAVNDDLETLHWALFNDFVAIPGLDHYIIPIKREHVADLIEAQKDIELDAIEKRDEIIKFMRDKIGVK
jgi:hypothetical protein